MKRRRALIAVAVILVLLIIATVVAYIIYKNRPNKPVEPTNVVVEVDKIKDYDYILEDRDTKLYKDYFKELDKVLRQDEIDYKEYASLISKMYIADLYTIDNKINKYDIGGLEFIHEDHKENFRLNAEDTLYKYVEDNSYKQRKQDLPVVKEVTIKEITEEGSPIGDKIYDGYKVSLEWTYEKDLKYDTKAILKIVNLNKKLYIVKQSVSE